jgi:hypothetical protein
MSRRALCRPVFAIVLVIASLASTPRPALGQAPRIAVAIVTHPGLRTSDVSFLELRKIFLGEKQYWNDGTRIVLLVRAPVARERDIVLEQIYRMEEAEFQQYWIAKVFRAEVSAKPKIVYSSEMIRELITALPGAVAFLPADEVGSGMKVLRINGKQPGEAGYPLQ